MTGPTTAGQLLALAADQLQTLHRRAHTDQAGSASALAAAWPAFQRAGARLTAALTPGNREPTRTAPGPDERTAATAKPAGEPLPGLDRPEPHLQRAADLVGAAADLVGARDRSGLAAEHATADSAYVSQLLVSAAYLVSATAASHRALLTTSAAAAGAASIWSKALPAHGHPTASASLSDATTALSQPSRGAGEHTDLVVAALHHWQVVAVAAAQQSAPSRAELRGVALTAGGLMALSQTLLRAHADAVGPDEAVAVTIDRLRLAGTGWNTAAEGWQLTATGGEPSFALVQARVVMDQTINKFARSADGWTTSEQLRATAGPDGALDLARGALAAVQAVAEQHATLVNRLAQTGALYGAAKHLAPTLDRVHARLTGQWLPIPAVECAPLVDAYQTLPAATAAARISLTTLTSRPGHADRHLPQLAATPAGAADRARHTAPPDQQPPPTLATTLAGQRWQRTLVELDPRLVTDPHFPALAAALDRVELAGVDVTASLAAATAKPLPDAHTARALHYQLIQICPAASSPYTRPTGPPPIPARTMADRPPGSAPAARRTPTGPSIRR